jgi:hypothetical protein
MLDAKAERAVTDASELLRSIFGARLLAVAVYGSAAGEDYVAGVSDVNLVVVLDEVRYGDLRAVQKHVKTWRRDRIATPLILDEKFLRDAADVFPMELHDIRAQHRTLLGEDVFARLETSEDLVRFQCEHEARGKLLRLRELYLEIAGDRRDLRRLMLDSLKTFLVVMRHLCRIDGAAAPAGYRDVLSRFGAQFGGSFPTFSRLLDVRLGAVKWEGDDESSFERYLGELQQVVDVVDRLGSRPTPQSTRRPPSHQP